MARPVNVVEAESPRQATVEVQLQPNITTLRLTMWQGEADGWDDDGVSVLLRRPEVERLRDQLNEYLDRGTL